MARPLIIYGGAFDPPHRAHVELPCRVREKLDAEAVIYVPVGVPPHKPRKLTPAVHRVKMLELALQDVPAARVDLIEVERAADGQPTYTVDTLEAFRRHGYGDMRLLIGTDQMRDFHTWKDPQRIIELAEPVVMARGHDQLPDPSWSDRIVDTPVMHISATELRRRVNEGESLAGLVHPDVERYILEHRLYRTR